MTEPKPKRRWYQFSLRTLLVVVLVLSPFFAWVGWELEKTRREQAVVGTIEAFGGWVEYHEPNLPPRIAQYFRRTQKVDMQLPFSVTRDGSLAFHPTIDDNSMTLFEGFTGLEELNLQWTDITDSGLEHLRGLTNLKKLDLSASRVTPEGVEELRRALPNCVIRCGP